ncbi:Quinic acid utilization activator [Penicillium subrubescens]|uniref:Quinic acid utilization activator n=1 Tax=Penicillium subrubescens TaxID=1316194 RepID=A0A1Q5U2K8_9EURO|nr:Quinic acid utilization activator [Penicillium subrubescens]
MDNDGSRSQAAKRKRISRACDPCRSRKHRCDGQQPSCSACSSTQQSCSYDSSMKKRGLPTGYVRSLELLWALLFTVIPQSMRLVTQLIPDIRFALDSHTKLVMVSKFVKDPDILRQIWEDSGIQVALDNLLSNASDNFSADEISSSVESKPVSTVESLQFTVGSFEASQFQVADGGQQVSNPVLWLEGTNNSEGISQHHLSTAYTWPADRVALSSFPQNAQRLLDLYFARTHCWLPIVQKHKMYEILYSSSPPAQAGHLATFWAILACASLQDSCEPFGLPGVPDGYGVVLTPEQIFLQARQQIPNEEAQELGYVQALLILSLFKLDRGEVAKAWRLIGQAVRQILDLGTLPPKGYSSNAARCSSHDDQQARLLLSCFVLDTVVSCHLKKAPHLRTMDIRSLPMPAETGPDEWEPSVVCLGESEHRRPSSFMVKRQPLRAVSIFNHYVGIISILNDAISEPLVDVSDSAHAKHSSALCRWCDQLPEHCKFPLDSSQNHFEVAKGLSPQLFNLHLAFKSTEMLLEAQHASIPRSGQSSHPPPRASSSDLVVPYLPTPMDDEEFTLAGIKGTPLNSGRSSSCEAPEDTMNEHEKRIWKELFELVDADETNLSSFSIQGSIDHSKDTE